MYPAYVRTNISKNAATGSGEAFGKLDDNIKSGMSCEDASEIILKAIYLKRSQIIVGSFFYWIIPKIAFLSSTMNDFFSSMKYKS